MNGAPLAKTLRGAWLIALVLAVAACRKTDDALLVVYLTSADGALADVQRLEVSVSTVPGAAPLETATLSYPRPDGATVTTPATHLPLVGIVLPGDTGEVVVEIEAYGAAPAPIASGRSMATPHAGRQTIVEMTFDWHPRVDGGADASGADAADAADGAAGGAGEPDRGWAAWPMPNSLADTRAGAPNPASYTDNDDGTITDDVTGLMWQRLVERAANVEQGIFTQATARAYCAGLTLGPFDDWRLPSLIELASLVDDDTFTPSLSPKFGAAPPTPTWSSTPKADDATRSWTVNFVRGLHESAPNSTLRHVRCVRGGGPAAAVHYTTDASTVTDNQTKLTWQRSVSTATSGANAQAYCQALGGTLGGTWRLPTKKELLTLADPSRQNPSIDPSAFPLAPAIAFWSSTPVAGAATASWAVEFLLGTPHYDPSPTPDRVRCVRR
jgi:hypothetical protein